MHFGVDTILLCLSLCPAGGVMSLCSLLYSFISLVKVKNNTFPYSHNDVKQGIQPTYLLFNPEYSVLIHNIHTVSLITICLYLYLSQRNVGGCIFFLFFNNSFDCSVKHCCARMYGTLVDMSNVINTIKYVKIQSQ